MIRNITIASLVLTLAVAGGVATAGKREIGRHGGDMQPAGAEPAGAELEEQDDPGARQRWRDEWFNENYGQTGRQAKQRLFRQGLWSPEYQRFMMGAAKRERLRYSSKMPRTAASDVVFDPTSPIKARSPAGSLSSALRWTNIGPTKASFLRNGSAMLNVIDSGRVIDIATDPTSPDTVYAAFAGGGLWRSLDGGAFWQAMTETLGSLSVGAMAMDPNNASILYLGLGNAFDGTGLGVVKMTERGEAWADPVFLGDSSNIRDILVAPRNSNIVLVATDKGLYRSADAGKSYSLVTIDRAATEIPGVWSLH